MGCFPKLYKGIYSCMSHKISLAKTHLMLSHFHWQLRFFGPENKKLSCAELWRKRVKNVPSKMLTTIVKFKMINPAFDNTRYESSCLPLSTNNNKKQQQHILQVEHAVWGHQKMKKRNHFCTATCSFWRVEQFDKVNTETELCETFSPLC